MSRAASPATPSTRPLRAVIVTVGLIGLTAAMFAPWVRSGTRNRHAFATVDVADSLGLIGAPWDSVLFVAWHAVPLLAAVAALLVWTGNGLAVPVGGAAALVGGSGAMIVLTSPVESGVGVPITVGAAALSLIALGEWWRTTR